MLSANMRNAVELRVHWVPGHVNFPLNENADINTKRAAKGDVTGGDDLPKLLKKPLPSSIAAI